jgi:hypothetical protein
VKKRRKKSKKQPKPKLSEPAPILEATEQPIAALEKSAAIVSEAPKPSWTRTTLKWAKRVISLIVGPALGVVVAIYTFWGPPWPTAPVFLATVGASASSPLDVPFVIKNESGFFALEGIQLTCKALMVSSVDPSGKPLVGVWNSTFERRIAGAINYIGPTKSAPYTCPMQGIIPSDAKVTNAAIVVTMQYESSWRWPNRIYTAAEGFTFNPHSDPPQWIIGLPLR